MFSEAALTKANIVAFLKEKGLYDECGEWCQPLYVKQEQEKAVKKATEPVGERKFYWEGHHTRCCYECSGERFNDTGSWEAVCNWLELIPVDFTELEPTENASKGYIKLKDIPEFNSICSRMMKFVNGDLDEDVDRCFDFDKFGFDNEPSKEQLTEWLGNLSVNAYDIRDIDIDEWFTGPSF